MKITKRQLKRIIREEKAKIHESYKEEEMRLEGQLLDALHNIWTAYVMEAPSFGTDVSGQVTADLEREAKAKIESVVDMFLGDMGY